MFQVKDREHATIMLVLEHVFGAWDGLLHTPGRAVDLADSQVWMMAMSLDNDPPHLGVKGATLGSALNWRFPPSKTPGPGVVSHTLPVHTSAVLVLVG